MGSLSSVVVYLHGSATDHMPFKLTYNGIGILVVVEVYEAVRWIPTGEGVDRHVDVEASEREY
jgi:hypothetical protein